MNGKDDILGKLDAEDEEFRLQGLRELAACEKAEDYLAAVLRSLGDPSWRVRKEAVGIFLSLPKAGSLAGEVIELLHSEENAGLRTPPSKFSSTSGARPSPCSWRS